MNEDVLFRKHFLELPVKRRTEEHKGAVKLVEKALSFAGVISYLNSCSPWICLREMFEYPQCFDILSG